MAGPPDDTIASEQKVSEESLPESVSSLGVELSRISAEIQSINSGFQAQIQAALVETQKQIREELQKEFDRELERRMARINETRQEIERAVAALDTISKDIDGLLDDHGTDLSQIIRKKAVQAEMKAYLDGLRFALSD